MKKIYKLLTVSALLMSSLSWAQCTTGSAYTSATVNSCAPATTIASCYYGGEFAPITFNVTGPYQFTSTGAGQYLTLQNSAGTAVAFGFSPLNYTITATGSYTLYVHTNAACGTDATCHALAYSCLNACNPVTAMATTTVSGTSGTFTWTAPAGNFDVYYGPAPLTAPNATTVPTATTATNSFTATGLNSSTAYAAYVRTNCGATQSTWVLTTFTTTCAGTPNAGITAVNTSTTLCSSQNVNLSLTGASVGGGLTYQWLSSPTGSGYTAIPSTTLATTTQSVTGTIYYQCVVACGSNTAASTPIQINIATTTTNTVPYFEGFEGITANDQLPNCSWVASNLPTICKTYTASSTYNRIPKTGTKFGSFRYGTNTAGDYFYTNGIQLTAGVNYIASTDYITDGLSGWSEFRLLYGVSQSTTGLVSIAAVTGTLTNTVHANVNGTFSVSATGIYYIAIKAIGNSTPWYLSFDDVSVIAAPTCTLAPVAGVISGTTSTNIGSTNAYTVSPATGNIQWYTGSSATGPWSAISGATLATSQNITATSAGTVYYTTIASTPGCPNDTSNTALAVTVLFPGNDVCSPIALTTGTSSVYSLLGATTQTGEVAPPASGCLVNNGWCNSTLHNTMWFTFTAPASGNVSVRAPGFDDQLAIWSTTNCANLIGQATPTAPIGATLIAANDDDDNFGGTIDASQVNASCLTPGATYYLQLDSYSAASSTSTTSIIITDLGVYDASFSGLASSYCLPASSSSLMPAVTGGVFTVSGSTTTVTSFTPSTAGTFTVTYNNVSTACMTSSTTIVANTPSVAAASNSTLSCDGAPVVLTASTSATSYTWMPSGGNGLTANVSPTTTTVYTVTVADGACTASATVTQNVNTCTSLQTLTSNTANMYPNPNTGLVNIALSADLMNGSSIVVYDALGKLVLSQNLTNEVNAINTSKLEAGIYMYTIINNNQTVKVGRMIKQ